MVVAYIGWRWVGEPVPLEARALVPLTILGGAGVLLRERRLSPHLAVTVVTVVLAAAIPLAGPTGASLIGAISFLVDVRARTWRARLFNGAMTGAVGAIGESPTSCWAVSTSARPPRTHRACSWRSACRCWARTA
ncbi:hypothetical protein [Ornithinimicrobium flavum]|uniref:hypothetical protein n=1 Tax=Ornithinimicrobium flavum TaxID=1288636 RepID=UPI00106FCCDA|nr:hypothetical protein [Ornithinimicrobium flavum]